MFWKTKSLDKKTLVNCCCCGLMQRYIIVDDAVKTIKDVVNNCNRDFENGDKAVFWKDDKVVTIRKKLREKGKKK